MYSYGYSSSYGAASSVSAFGSAFFILLLIAMLAAVVLSVVLYRQLARPDEDEKIKLSNPEGLKSFLRFDTMVIDKVLRFFYLLAALMTAGFILAIVLASMAIGFGTFVIFLLLGAVFLVVLELGIRLGYESVMLRVIIARNTTQIKNKLDAKTPPALPPSPHAPAPGPGPAPAPGSTPVPGFKPVPAPGSAPVPGSTPASARPVPPAPVPTPAPPTSPASVTPSSSPQQSETPTSASGTTSGTTSGSKPAKDSKAPAKKFCTSCGKENASNAAFCYNCGNTLS